MQPWSQQRRYFGIRRSLCNFVMLKPTSLYKVRKDPQGLSPVKRRGSTGYSISNITVLASCSWRFIWCGDCTIEWEAAPAPYWKDKNLEVWNARGGSRKLSLIYSARALGSRRCVDRCPRASMHTSIYEIHGNCIFPDSAPIKSVSLEVTKLTFSLI